LPWLVSLPFTLGLTDDSAFEEFDLSSAFAVLNEEGSASLNL